MTAAVLEVVQLLEEARQDMRELPPIHHLAEARRAIDAAMRADPEAGTGRRRIERARMAAARCILALESMDGTGKWAKP